MDSHCDEHDAEFAALVGADHGAHEEVTDLGPWAGEWKSNWSFSQSDLQAGYDAILAATPELTPDLLSQFIEAINYTSFNKLSVDGSSVAYDGIACDYGYTEQSPDGNVLFETADEACSEARYLLLGIPYGAVEDGTFHFHMRIAASYDEVTDEQSLSFPSVFMDWIDAAIINTMYTAFARDIGMYVATVYGVEIALSDEEMAAMSGEQDDHAHEEDDHAHEDDDHAHEHEDDHAHEEDDHGHEEDSHDHAHSDSATLGRLEDIECAGHDHGHDHDHGHEEGSCDPHVWLDPHNVVYWALTIRDSYSEIDPDNASEYHELALAYAVELDSLESDFIWPALENLPEEKRLLVTAHDALGYLAGTFGFEIVSTVIPGVSTVVEPSASDVAEVIDVIREHELTAIFGESITSDKILQVIAAETGVEIASLYTDSLSLADGPAATYLDYMRYNFTTIVEALSG